MVEAKGWRTVNQTHTEQYMPNGNFEPVVKVFIMTDNGTPASFAFPEGQYTADNVATQINAWVEREQAVAALGNKG